MGMCARFLCWGERRRKIKQLLVLSKGKRLEVPSLPAILSVFLSFLKTNSRCFLSCLKYVFCLSRCHLLFLVKHKRLLCSGWDLPSNLCKDIIASLSMMGISILLQVWIVFAFVHCLFFHDNHVTLDQSACNWRIHPSNSPLVIFSLLITAICVTDLAFPHSILQVISFITAFILN